MMSVSGYMDSYPMQGNQMPSNQNCHPSYEAVPYLAKVDLSKSIMNQPWPYANNFGCSVPFYPYCSHGNFPGYYGYTPCPHFSSPPFHYCGHHPPFPDTFPVHYVPPPNYLRELPRYEFDKPRDNDYHCCGYPNHTHNLRNGGGMKIEEQVPDVQNKAGNSLVPFQLKNYPYPILWFPPEYLINKEHKRSLESDTASRDNFAQDKKPSEDVKPSEQDPRVWSSWFPVDMKSLRSLMRGDDRGSIQDQENEKKKGQCPFPIFWMPYEQDEVANEKHGEKDIATKSMKELGSIDKFFSAKVPSSGDSMKKAQVVHESSEGQVNSELKEKGHNQITIPVKQMEAPMEKYDAEDTERRESDTSLKNAEDNKMVKASGANTRQSSSSPKASKLPPVCLRVDPLPQKKNGNMGLRSPSPGLQEQSREITDKTPMDSVSSNLIANNCQNSKVQGGTPSSSKVAEPKQNKDKIVEVVKSKTGKNMDREQRSGYEHQFPTVSSVKEEASQSITVEKIENNEDKCVIKEDEGSRNADELTAEQANETEKSINSSISGDGELKVEKKKLSDEEAALRIQSAFRGFEVRKWEPLKKLKQIARVQEQLIEIRNKICQLEFSYDLQKDEKHRAVIGEMIMSLLLKLDTVQGLHPSLRDIRKSLARELVTLQEKLDLLAKAKSSENPPINADNIVGNIVGIEEGLKKDAKENPNHEFCQPMDIVCDKQCLETSKALLVDKEERKFENGAGALESHLEEPSNAVNGEFDSCDALITENLVPSDVEQISQLPLEDWGYEEKAGAQLENIWCITDSKGLSELVEVNESMHRGDNQVNESEILPVGVADMEPNASAEEEEIGTNVICGRQNELVEPLAAIADKPKISNEIAEINLFKELPVGVIDDEEPEEPGRSEIQDNEVLPDRDVECEATIDAFEQKPAETYVEGQVNIDASLLGGVSGLSEAGHQPVEVFNGGVTVTEAALLDSGVPAECKSQLQAMEEFSEGVLKVVNQNDSFTIEEMPNMQETQALQVNEEQNDYQRCISEVPTTMIICGKEPHIGDDQDNVGQPKAGNVNEDIVKEQNEHVGLDMVSGYDEMVNQHKGMETSERESVNGERDHPVPTEKEKSGVVPLSAASDQQSMKEMEMEVDRKLVEENEKMRMMVEKLIEAGKDQLAVISNLTGRVKDLEKMLSKRKKMRARRCRTAISPPLRSTSLTPSLRKRAAGLAM